MFEMPRFTRRTSPPQFNNYQSYRPYLRQDFLKRCCYCGFREIEGVEGFFHVEHFRPKKSFDHLACAYSNLYYSCAICNWTKSDTWPSDAEILRGERFWDPCQDRSIDHFRCDSSSGEISHLSPCGQYTIDEIDLDRPLLRQMRIKRIHRQKRFREALIVLRNIREQLNPDSLSPNLRQVLVAQIQATLADIRETL